MPRNKPTTSYNTRSKPTTNWTDRLYPGEDCLVIIETGNWDDNQIWTDETIKYWWDVGSVGTAWSKRNTPTTTWS